MLRELKSQTKELKLATPNSESNSTIKPASNKPPPPPQRPIARVLLENFVPPFKEK